MKPLLTSSLLSVNPTATIVWTEFSYCYLITANYLQHTDDDFVVNLQRFTILVTQWTVNSRKLMVILLSMLEPLLVYRLPTKTCEKFLNVF